MNLFEKFQLGLPMQAFLERFGTPAQKDRWLASKSKVMLTEPMIELLKLFKREMNILVLAGAWCGDCANQCPMFERFADIFPGIHVRYLDRDFHADVQAYLQINGGNRVPAVVFLSEDGFEAGRYGERTLSQYRQQVKNQIGESCSTGIVSKDDPLQMQICQDWLNEFERIQWILRLSSRLRQKHGD